MCLSRLPDEEIHLLMPDGSEIRVVMLGFKGGAARLGISANDDVTILRKELRDRMDAEAPRTVACPCGKLNPAAAPACDRCGRERA